VPHSRGYFAKRAATPFQLKHLFNGQAEMV
jgi:hypothetical protein